MSNPHFPPWTPSVCICIDLVPDAACPAHSPVLSVEPGLDRKMDETLSEEIARLTAALQEIANLSKLPWTEVSDTEEERWEARQHPFTVAYNIAWKALKK